MRHVLGLNNVKLEVMLFKRIFIKKNFNLMNTVHNTYWLTRIKCLCKRHNDIQRNNCLKC